MFSVKISSTFMSFIIFTPFNCFSNAFTTSCALSLTGNILFPLSTFVGISSNFIMSLFVKFLKELYRNFPFPGVFLIKSSMFSSDDVILHLPLPVIESFFPRVAFFSSSVTSLFDFFAVIAAIIPAGPPPITITFINFLLAFLAIFILHFHIYLALCFTIILEYYLQLLLVQVFHIHKLAHLVGMQ